MLTKVFFYNKYLYTHILSKYTELHYVWNKTVNQKDLYCSFQPYMSLDIYPKAK